jgi:TRAP transporter TAXI family solute receptor
VVAKAGVPYVPGVLPAGSYPGQDGGVPTALVGNYLVSQSRVSDDLGYAITKTLWENRDRLAAAHSAAAGLKLESALEGLPIPLHPGAARYYRERGLNPPGK